MFQRTYDVIPVNSFLLVHLPRALAHTYPLHTHISGCNNCLINDGVLGRCTDMACVTLGQPYCSQFKDGMQCTGPNKCSAPEDCVSFFDGCNVCGSRQGGVSICTRRYCEDLQQPYCQAYADGRKCEALDQCSSEAVVKG